MFEDNTPVVKPERTIDLLSVNELTERIAQLKEELRLCEIELKKKQSHLESAERLFGD